VDVERLADALITNTSGRDSIGQIYHFLCRNHDASIAREEFVRFLRGERPELLLREARHVATATRHDLCAGSDNLPTPFAGGLQNTV
jgi:hypothetical protein